MVLSEIDAANNRLIIEWNQVKDTVTYSNPVTFEAMMVRLALVNLADVDPHPVEYAIFASHPSPVRRIAMARAWARVGERDRVASSGPDRAMRKPGP